MFFSTATRPDIKPDRAFVRQARAGHGMEFLHVHAARPYAQMLEAVALPVRASSVLVATITAVAGP